MITLIDQDLIRLIKNSQMRDQLEYALFPGKRLRGSLLLTLLASSDCEISQQAIAAAAAIELTHAFSLVHDDMPALDNSDLRRGKPSFFKKFGENNALLVGDMLQYLAQFHLRQYSALLNLLVYYSGPGGMVLGQWLECNYGAENVSDLQRIQDLKSAKLFELAAAMASEIMQISEKDLLFIGLGIGRCLQWLDDIHDVLEDSPKTNMLHFKSESQLVNEINRTLSAVKDTSSKMPKGYYLRSWLELNFDKEVFKILVNN